MTIDFTLEEIGMRPTPSGMVFSRKGEPELSLVDLHVTIEAMSRNQWWITEVGMVGTTYSVNGKYRQVVHPLEGRLKDDAIAFLYAHKREDLDERVDEEMPQTYEDRHPYQPVRI